MLKNLKINKCKKLCGEGEGSTYEVDHIKRVQSNWCNPSGKQFKSLKHVVRFDKCTSNLQKNYSLLLHTTDTLGKKLKELKYFLLKMGIDSDPCSLLIDSC